MLRRIVAVVLLVVSTVAIENRFFDEPAVESVVVGGIEHHPVAGTVIAYHENEYQRYAVDLLTQMGKLESWSCLYELWTRESNWRPKAYNKTSGAYGIAQFMPVTWSLVGFKRTSDGFIQVEAGLAYIQRKYGGNICKALGSNISRGWY